MKRSRVEISYERYNAFLSEIIDKFVHSFDVLITCDMARREDKYKEIGKEIAETDFSSVQFVFLLIIHGHKEEWCMPLQEELNRRLLYHNKIWGSKIVVMNDLTAKNKYKLIT